jgi:translocation and assembly module TamB
MTPRLRLAFQVFGAFVAVTLVLVVGALVLLHSPPGERLAARLAATALSRPGRAVAVEGLRIDWPFVVSADAVRLSDAEGVWLTVRRPFVDWYPGHLLRGVVDIDRLAAERVELARAPLPSPQGGRFSPPSLTLNLNAVALPIELAPAVLGERLAVELSGEVHVKHGGGDVELHLGGDDDLQARLTGTAGRDFLDLRWYLRVPRLARWQKLAGTQLAGDLAAHGYVAGRLPQPVIGATIDAGAGRGGPLGWDALSAELTAIPERTRWRLSLAGSVRAPRLGKPKPLAPSADIVVAGGLDPVRGVIEVGRLRFSAAGLRLSGFGIAEQWGRRANVMARVEVPRLEELVRPSGTAKGRLFAWVHVAGDLVGGRLDALASLRAQGFSSGIRALDRLLGPAPRGEATLALRPGLPVRVSGARLEGGNGTAWAMGEVGRRFGLWTTVKVSDLSVFTVRLAGAAVAEGRLVGSVDDPAAYGVARSTGFAIVKIPATGAAGFDFRHLTGDQEGQVTADLSLAGRPVSAAARVVVAEPVRIDDLRLESGPDRVGGALAVSQAGDVSGRLEGHAADLARWAALAKLPLAGSADLDAVFDPAQGQSARLAILASGLRAAEVRAGSARLDADLHGLFGRPFGSASLVGEGIERGELVLSRASARLEGSPAGFRFVLDAAGSPARPAGLAAAGSGRLGQGGGEARLDRLRLSYGGQEARLLSPFMGRWTQGGATVQPAHLEVAGGRLEVEGGVRQGTIDGHLRLDGVPLALVELVKPGLDAVGRVSGAVRLAGTLGSPEAFVNLTGDEIGFAAAARAGIGRLAASLVGQWRRGRATATLNARDGEHLALRAEGEFPLTADGLPPAGTITGHAHLSGEMARLMEVVPMAGHALSGRLVADFGVSGTVAAPIVDGSASLGNGRYENLEQGTIVTNLVADVTVSGDTVRAEASGQDGGSGTVRLNGRGDVGRRSWRADIALNDFRAVRRDDADATLSGDLAASGTGDQGRLGGSVTVDRADIDIGRLRRGGATELQVTEINRPGGVPPPREQTAAPGLGSALELGLDVDIQHAFVRGRGLQSEWEGRLEVGGTLDKPAITGRVTALRGDYDVLGKTFRLTRDSTITFTGGQPIIPDLAVTAESRTADITAKVEVTGPATKPSVDFSSDPPLPRDEVVSRLLFGKGAGSLSAFQQVQLARLAATGLSGEEGGGFDPLGDLRGALGLDVLDVGSATQGKGGQAGGPTLSAGKYIAPDTFLRIEQGTSGLGRVTVEQELGAGFSVETSVGEQSGGGLGVTWRKDY